MIELYPYLVLILILAGYSALLPLVFYFYFVRTYLKIKEVSSEDLGE